jgi:hypothetical protein
MENKRIEELKEQIEAINVKLAEIEGKVEKNLNYDAESIERQKLNVAKFNLQKELHNELEKTKAVEEIIKEIEEINAKLAEIEKQVEMHPNYDAESIERQKLNVRKYNLQQQLKIALGKINTQEPPVSQGQNGAGKDGDEGQGQNGTGKDGDEGQGQNGTGKDGDEGQGQNGAGKDGDEGQGQNGTGKDGDEGQGQNGTGKDDEIVEVAGLWALVLKFVRFIKSHVSPEGRIGKWCESLEGQILGQVKALPDGEDKTQNSDGNSKDESNKSKNTPVREESQNEEQNESPTMTDEDKNWIKEKMKTADRKEEFTKISQKAYDKIKTENQQNDDKGNDKFIEDISRTIYDDIHRKAEKQGINLKDKDGKNRSLEEIYKDLDEKIKLQQRTNQVSRQAAKGKDEEDKNRGKATPQGRPQGKTSRPKTSRENRR